MYLYSERVGARVA